jgi:uncharacterized cysteine cluster protein YcgN (CxxCxxCC family)
VEAAFSPFKMESIMNFSEEDLPPLDCDGCTACCRGELIYLLPHEIPIYETEMIYGKEAIAHKPNDDCLYLSPVGCTIHEQKPIKCSDFDCRKLVMRFGDKLNDMQVKPEMVEAGKRKLSEAIIQMGKCSDGQ